MHIRVAYKLFDYFAYSLPLIILAFLAAGFAISMLFADVLSNTDVAKSILDVSPTSGMRRLVAVWISSPAHWQRLGAVLVCFDVVQLSEGCECAPLTSCGW